MCCLCITSFQNLLLKHIGGRFHCSPRFYQEISIFCFLFFHVILKVRTWVNKMTHHKFRGFDYQSYLCLQTTKHPKGLNTFTQSLNSSTNVIAISESFKISTAWVKMEGAKEDPRLENQWCRYQEISMWINLTERNGNHLSGLTITM